MLAALLDWKNAWPISMVEHYAYHRFLLIWCNKLYISACATISSSMPIICIDTILRLYHALCSPRLSYPRAFLPDEWSGIGLYSISGGCWRLPAHEIRPYVRVDGLAYWALTLQHFSHEVRRAMTRREAFRRQASIMAIIKPINIIFRRNIENIDYLFMPPIAWWCTALSMCSYATQPILAQW